MHCLINKLSNRYSSNLLTYYRKQNETKHQLLINKREGTGLKYFNDSEAFIEYLNDMDDIDCI